MAYDPIPPTIQTLREKAATMVAELGRRGFALVDALPESVVDATLDDRLEVTEDFAQQLVQLRTHFERAVDELHRLHQQVALTLKALHEKRQESATS